MKKNFYNPDVTEMLYSFAGGHYAACYPSSYILSLSSHTALSQPGRKVSVPNYVVDETLLFIIPLHKRRLLSLLLAPERYVDLQAPSVRLAINYRILKHYLPALRQLAQRFRFWLYDFAPPGADWNQLHSLPLHGIVFNEHFFNDNYHKFSFPHLLAALHDKKIDLLIRARVLQLPEEDYSALYIKGWQQQRLNNGDLFSN